MRLTARIGTVAAGAVLQVMRAFTRDLCGARDLRFGEDALETVVDLRREEADGGFDEGIACGVEDRHGKAPADLAGALRGDIDVGFEVGVFVDGGEDGGGRDVVA